jgi:hypothetical protein
VVLVAVLAQRMAHASAIRGELIGDGSRAGIDIACQEIGSAATHSRFA